MDFSHHRVLIASTMLLSTIIYMNYGNLSFQENTLFAFSSSPQSSLSGNWEHHVFPSFHGADVRRSFLSHILKELRSKGIDTFLDNEIKRGEPIGPEIQRAIRGSMIAIVLLSKNYASSSWCLDELVKIMKYRKTLGQTVITIFYDVDPTDVEKQAGDFGKAFRKTCKGKTFELTEKWRKALTVVATIAGYHSKNWYDEAAMIEKVTTDISNRLNEVRMIGIWSLPRICFFLFFFVGLGSMICKTTIARFLCNHLSTNAQLSKVMVNTKDIVTYHRSGEGSAQLQLQRVVPAHCLDEISAQLQLQNQMLSQMLNHGYMLTPHRLCEGRAQLQLQSERLSRMIYHKYMVTPHSRRIKLDDEVLMENIATDISNMLSVATLSRDLEDFPELPRKWIHDVFPSFHGADVRSSFAGHILKEFDRKGINTFIDIEIETRGLDVNKYRTAIRGSKIAFVLLSKRYASSSWCLDELVEIMKCREDLGQTVITVFYAVNPTNVKKQTGAFGKAFRETCQGKSNEKIETWRKALEDVATLVGYHSKNWDCEATMVQEIAAKIFRKC